MIPDVLAAVGPRLRILRERRGVTLTALAATTGISAPGVPRRANFMSLLISEDAG